VAWVVSFGAGFGVASLVWLALVDPRPSAECPSAECPSAVGPSALGQPNLRSLGSDPPASHRQQRLRPTPQPQEEPRVAPSEIEQNSEREPAGGASAIEISGLLSEAMTRADVRASFDLDCAGEHCFAVFDGEVPSNEQRNYVIEQVLESGHAGVISKTISQADGGVSWVLVLGEQELSATDQAMVDLRMAELGL
jgi:hypothetical protein